MKIFNCLFFVSCILHLNGISCIVVNPATFVTSSPSNSNHSSMPSFLAQIVNDAYNSIRSWGHFDVAKNSDQVLESLREKKAKQRSEIDHFIDEAFSIVTNEIPRGSKAESELFDAYRRYISASSENMWEFVGEEGDTKVWRCKHPLVKGKGAKWPCVKATTIINAPPKSLVGLLMDSSKIMLSNKYSAGRTDVEVVNERTKIVWSRTKIPLTIRPYDFCSIIFCDKLPRTEDSYVILSKSIEHALVPISAEYARSELYVGINVIEPVLSDGSKSRLTTVNHIRYAGLHPYLANRNIYAGTINYFKQLNRIATSLQKDD